MSFSEWETILVFHGVFNIFLYGGPLPGGKPDGLWIQFSWIYKAKKHLAGASLCINIMYYIGNLNVGLRIHYDIIIYYSCLYGHPLCPPAPNTFSDCIWSCFLGSKHLLREYLDVFGALGMYHLVIIFHYYIIIVYVIAMNP